MKTERVRIIIDVDEQYPLLVATRAFKAIKASAKAISVDAPKGVYIEKSNDNGETWSRVHNPGPKLSNERERDFMTKAEVLEVIFGDIDGDRVYMNECPELWEIDAK